MTVDIKFFSDDENSDEEKRRIMKNKSGIMMMSFVREHLILTMFF